MLLGFVHCSCLLPPAAATAAGSQPRAALTKSAFFTASFCHRLRMSSCMAAEELDRQESRTGRQLEGQHSTGGS